MPYSPNLKMLSMLRDAVCESALDPMLVQELSAGHQAHLQDSCPNHSSPLMPMNVNATFRIGSRGIRLAQGNSNQHRALYGDLPLDNMYVLKMPMSHQVAHAKKNQPGNMWPRCPPCMG